MIGLKIGVKQHRRVYYQIIPVSFLVLTQATFETQSPDQLVHSCGGWVTERVAVNRTL